MEDEEEEDDDDFDDEEEDDDEEDDDDDDDENVGDSGEGHDEKKTPAADQNSRYVYAYVPNSVNR